MSNKIHKAWLIDLDGTLYYPKSIKWFMAAELLLSAPQHISKVSQFRQAHESLRERFQHDPTLKLEQNPFQEQLEIAAKKLKISASKLREIIFPLMVTKPGKWLSLNRRESLIKEITDFRRQGGLTALVSDYPATAKLQAMSLSELFDVVIANGECDELRQLKPGPQAFLLAAERLGVSPTDCLVIGDRADADGAAASHAAMDFRLIR